MAMSRFGSYKTFIDALNSELESFPVETVSQMRIIKRNQFGKPRSFPRNKARNHGQPNKDAFQNFLFYNRVQPVISFETIRKTTFRLKDFDNPIVFYMFSSGNRNYDIL